MTLADRFLRFFSPTQTIYNVHILMIIQVYDVCELFLRGFCLPTLTQIISDSGTVLYYINYYTNVLVKPIICDFLNPSEFAQLPSSFFSSHSPTDL